MAGEVMDILFRARMNVSDVATGVGQIQRDLKKLELPKDITDNLEKGFNKVIPLIKEYQKILSKETKTPKDIKNLETLKAKIHEVMGDIKVDLNQINSTKIQPKADLSELKNINKEINSLEKQLSGKMSSLFKGKGISAESAQGIIDKMGRVTSLKGLVADVQLKFNQQDIQGYTKAVDALENKIKSIKTESTKIDIAKALGAKKGDLADLDNFFTNVFKNMRLDPTTVQKVAELRNNLRELEQTKTDKTFDSFKNGEQAINNVINAFSQLSDKSEQAGADVSKAGQSIMSMTEQVGQLQQSTQYFFSLRNMINLLKRGIDDAVQSVKELDKAMTDTAVVTDYKVSDLWGMLPQYTQLANQLGATTQGAYETMTLYFQQGLDQQQAFEVGAETMKMARIAGLDYAETTDMMTAALRGFNMELNETSAKRVNDVYSELAAITASDTEELGTAMQRTASIAHSAGASFEGTTAFLAQAIETTREPAENIGTAMKTIVARFQEMKKNPLEISEVDGEEVDYNKIDAALKTIGVDLKDTNGQFRDFDQVMLDISARWDSLSQSQQRYIATVAAGSRQQSRFIAMVSNYDRTMQLMEAANNSTGASDEQFGKTMDSLEAKLNKLHNAWQAFTMGIANNSMIKLAVDGLTGFLTVTNKIIDTLSLGSGAIKSFLSVFAAFTGLKIAGRTANSLIGGLGGLVDPQSTVKEGLKIGLFGQGKANAQAQAITNPIVGSLNRISQQIAQIKNNGINNKKQSGSEIKNTSKQDYLNIKAQFDKLSSKEGFKISDASSLFSQLDAKHQLSMFNNSPGTRAAMKKASMTWFDSKGLSKELNDEGKQYINAIYKGMQKGQIPVDKGIDLIGQPLKWGAYFGTDLAKSYTQAFVKETLSPSTQAAHEAAIASLGFNPQDYKVGSKELKDLFKNDKQLATQYASLYSGLRGDLDNTGHGQTKGKVSDLGRLANDIGSIGDKFTQAGYGITAFGNALSQVGGPIGIVGTGIASLGNAISSMGMMVSGATSLITVFSEGIEIAGTSIAISGGAIAAVAAPLAAAAAAFLLVRAHIKKVKEEGEKVTTTFNDINKETSSNVSKLKSYQSELATLSKGVDSNGNNVSLDDSQYQRYLEIVNDIAKINPEIVQGYNAQGHAIIDNNKALDETLKKQQQIQKEAFNTYTDKTSLQKLINARNVNSDYKGINIKGGTPGVYDGSGHGNEGRQRPIGLGSDVFKIADELRLMKGKDELGKTFKVDDKMLQKYGIESMDALISGEEQAVKNFIKHRDKIQAELTNSGFELSDSLIKGFDKLNTDQKAFDEAIQPVYDNLLASVSNSSLYKDLGSEFKGAISSGLKDIASQDLNASEMQSQANLLVQEFENLTREGGEYSKALEQVENAQDKFASSLDVSEYTKNTEDALSSLDTLLNKYKDDTTAYGQAIREYLENQIEKIRQFPQEGSISLTEALNGVTDTISAAEGAYNSFQETTKTDLSTGVENMKSIFDEITKETDGVALHMERFGDQTMWKGARALLGDKFVEENADNVEAIKTEIKSLESELQQGEKGFAAFWENFKQVDDSLIEGFHWNEDGSYDLDRNINPDAYKEIAEQMHRSEEYVVSMLNKGRQFADIDFTNIEDVRKALSTDDATIVGTSSTGGNKDLFVKKDYLENAMSEAGIYNPAEQAAEIEKFLAKGINVIPNAEDMTKQDFKNMGISDLPSLVQKLGDTGQFNRSEIEEYAKSLEGEGYNAKELDTAYQDYLDSQDHPELPSITSIDSNVASILGIIASNRVEQGYADQATIDAYEEAKNQVKGANGRGEKEADSLSELFALGKDKNGERLSESEYKLTRQALEDSIATYTKMVEASERGAEVAKQEGRDTDAAELAKEANGYATLVKWLQEDLAAGEKVHDNLKQETEDKKRQKTQNAPGMPSEVNNTLNEQTKQAEQHATDAQKREAAFNAANENALQNTENYLETKRIEEERKAEDAKKREEAFNAANAAARETATKQSELETSVLQAGWGQLLQNVPQDVLVTPEAQSAMQVLAQNAFDPNMVMTPTIESALATLGLTTADAYSAGSQALSDSLATAGQNTASSIEQGETEANQHLEALALNAMPGFAKIADNVQEKVNNFIDSINGINVPELTPTINQGTELVSGVAEKAVQATFGLDTTDADAKIEKTQANIEKTANTANQGATFRINVPGAKDLTSASKAANNIAKKAGTQTIGVKTGKVDTGSVQTATSSIKNTQADIRVGADASDAYGEVNQLVSSANHRSATIDIYANVKKSGISTISIEGKTVSVSAYAKGKNNHISTSSLPSFGSAARGRYGTVGPKDKGGLTLTGEEGFEIAWLPRENRSMILGANGPQMLNLPSDAVIYTHEQSKKIIKQKAKPAGSMDRGKYDPSSGTTTTPKSSGNGGGGGGGGGGGQDSDTIKTNADNAKNASKVIKDAGWVTVWWENMTRRVDSTQKKIDNLSAKFDKQIKTFGTTVTSIQSTVKGYRNNLNQSISLNKAEIKQAKKELKLLDAGGNFYSRKEVSYEETEGDKKESKKMTVSLGKYIKYNKKYGTYEIDQQKINQVGLKSWTGGDGKKHGGNKSLAEAIKQAAEKEINDRNSKIKTAEDNIKKAQEALEKVSNDVYETFYGWEKSINRVYLLGKKLETITQQLSVTNAKLDLQFNKIAAGATNAAGAQDKINKALEQQRDGLLNKANASKQNLSAAKSEFQNSLSLQPYLRNYLKNPDSSAARNDYIAAKKTLTFLDKVNLSGNNFNYTEALKYLNNAGMSKDEYDAIKNNLDKIFEKQSNYLQAQETAQQSISEIYQTMEEYQSFIADFEADLLTGMEEEAENQIQHLEKLNSSLTKALKDLLDEVKNRLDQRRKQEDNKKTESDLSQKQQRLTMLRADTGGGHAVEIAQLEKELAEAQQNYQRTLEDQLLERLQQQGDIAEKQRQHQIDLLSIQNQIAKETGTNLAQVKEWMNDPEKYYEQIRAAWLENQHYDEVAPNEQKNLEEQFEQNFAKFRGYKEQLDKYDKMIGQLNTLENDVNRIATEISLDKPKHTAADMKAKGYSAYSLKKAGYNVSSLVNAGYNKNELKEAGITAKNLAKNKVSASAAKKAGFSAKDLMQAGYSAKSLLKAGYNPISVAKAGYSGKQLKEAGITSYLSKKGITNINQAIKSGISKSVASGIYGAKASLKDANLSGALTQKATGASLPTLQKIVNENPNDKATQKDLAGVKTKIDINGKDKGGITEGSVNANGKWIYANIGSTLKGQRLDTKTGKGTGKVYTVTIDKLAEEHFKNNKTEATQALVYAITHQAWGSKINSNFSALVKAAGIKGKQYKLGAADHNWYASVGGDGLIYQNTADGVAKWNPATGKTWIEKYNQKNFLAIAKRNNGVSREYAQVLINKKAYTKKALQKLGVKQFRTGGLADYTGPAWLDGTPAKPELVLNAQDTKNFIALKDVLSRAIGSTSSVSNEYGGDATYEININVDHLNSDYDVDKVAERVKKIIVKDSSYRNVTQVRKFR